MSLKARREQAKQTSKATKRIGLVAQLIVTAGVAPYGRGITSALKTECYRPYEDGVEEYTTRANVEAITEEAIKYLPIKGFSVGPVLSVQVVKDTSLTPASRWTGGMFSMEDYDKTNRFTHKRHADMIFDLMSKEIDDLDGQKFWAHVNWRPLTEDYGGEYAKNLEERNDELCIIITHLANKRAAVDLVKALREGEITTDELAIASGYDVEATRAAIREAAGKDKDDEADKPAQLHLSDIGKKTKSFYMTLEGFTKPDTVDFLKKNFHNEGDINLVAEKCGADPGDIAIILNQPEYFRSLMTQTGLGEQEALVKVAEDTGLANPKDLAVFLGISEPAF